MNDITDDHLSESRGYEYKSGNRLDDQVESNKEPRPLSRTCRDTGVAYTVYGTIPSLCHMK